MPTNSFVLRNVLLLPLLVITAITQATESAMPSYERLSARITYTESTSGDGFATLTVAPISPDDRADITVPGDINLFRIPLVGNMQDFGFRSATADGGGFDRLTQQALFIDFRLPWT